MMDPAASTFSRRAKALLCPALCLACIALNWLLRRLAMLTGIPLYLDSVGTVLAAVTGGYLPGMLVGFFSNLLIGAGQNMSEYYCMISVLIAALSAFLARCGWFRSFPSSLRAFPLLALIGGGLGSLLTFALYGLDFGEELSASLAHFFYDNGLKSVFWSQFSGDVVIDLADKLVVVVLVWLILRLIPDHVLRGFSFRIWQQNPLSAEERVKSGSFGVRRMSLRPKLMLLVMAGMILVALLTTSIGYRNFRDALFQARGEMGENATRVLASSMDPDRVDEYLELGRNAPGYNESEQAMANVRDSSDDIKYVYVYRIEKDGCHVVFDPDPVEDGGSEPGEIIDFDEDFLHDLPKLLKGEAIDPIESHGQYGWLYSIYTPVKDSGGRTVCYACADISMEKLSQDLFSYLAKTLSLFVSIISLLMAFFLLLAESGIILPINSMSLASGRFAFDSEEQRNDSVEQLRSLRIHTGDEIENLYHAISKTTDDSVRYIAETQQKSETIARMQENLITVLADMVESRDLYTGNHIKNTSAYARIVMEQLRKEGVYTDQLTDEFIQNVVRSAPLHDIGKIRVSDTILNKPGKLTDEEFEKMKLHTVYGREVLQQAEKASSEVSYLCEAENLANYHHEKWNGRGYPAGLSGEDIPLSARIMAVADVFDALVSKRSYKDPFTFEQAMDIIREGAGSHFDPSVAAAFLHAEEEVRKVLAEQSEKYSV